MGSVLRARWLWTSDVENVDILLVRAAGSLTGKARRSGVLAVSAGEEGRA